MKRLALDVMNVKFLQNEQAVYGMEPYCKRILLSYILFSFLCLSVSHETRMRCVSDAALLYGSHLSTVLNRYTLNCSTLIYMFHTLPSAYGASCASLCLPILSPIKMQYHHTKPNVTRTQDEVSYCQ